MYHYIEATTNLKETSEDVSVPMLYDNSSAFLFGSGYNRYSLHCHTAGGLFGWTAKFARPTHVHHKMR
jgi:hypothetical protein